MCVPALLAQPADGLQYGLAADRPKITDQRKADGWSGADGDTRVGQLDQGRPPRWSAPKSVDPPADHFRRAKVHDFQRAPAGGRRIFGILTQRRVTPFHQLTTFVNPLDAIRRVSWGPGLRPP